MTLVQAEQNFYSDSTGNRSYGEVFEVKDQDTLQMLEQAGYVKQATGQAAQGHADQEARQQLMGQAQALANEAVSMTHHVQNMAANEHTQRIEQQTQQAQQNNVAPNQADQKVMQAQANQFQPTTPDPHAKANARKADK